jgi:glucose/arabinose dehydrogenase
MNYRIVIASVLFTFFLTVFIPPVSATTIVIERTFNHLSFVQPVDLQHAGDETDRLFIVSQIGQIFVFENDPAVDNAKIFLDVTDRVLTGGEQGLLGLAFHPDYKENGYFYVHYTAPNPRRNVISRFSVSADDPDAADDTSEQILFTVDQPQSNHNGGQIAFGPDEYLYISIGDGGGSGDPGNNAQNRGTMLGSILRINIDDQDEGKQYAIPPDNPFVDNTEEWHEEIYAYGLRNTWRFSFDPVTGWLYAGDVGQSAREEINIIENGKNYGWNIMEGTSCYPPGSTCDTTGLTLPIYEYVWGVDGRSVTGGYVYKGNLTGGYLRDWYFFADYVFGNVWALYYDGSEVTEISYVGQPQADRTVQISSFGVDQHGELYILGYNTGSIFSMKLIGSVDDIGNIPESFFLSDNYPNPFNPHTMIEFGITEERFVTVTVYNVLGEKVALPIAQHLSSGTYRFTWDAASLPSGIYYYRLDAGDYSSTKRMLLVK